MSDSVPVNVGASTRRSQITYDISDTVLTSLKDKNMNFKIETAEGGDVGVFTAEDNNGSLLAKEMSKPFPAGSIEKVKNQKRSDDCYVVTVKLNSASGMRLEDFF